MRTNASIIIALDYASANDALKIAEQLDPQQCRLKVGKELFIQTGPWLVENLMGKGFDVFLDLKFHELDLSGMMDRDEQVKAIRAWGLVGVYKMDEGEGMG